MTSERASAYGQVMKTIADVGPTKLQPAEADRIREAADTLFFCEDPREQRAAIEDVEALLDVLVESARWLESTAEVLLADLEDCGPQPAGFPRS
jgi:hypothetical protein